MGGIQSNVKKLVKGDAGDKNTFTEEDWEQAAEAERRHALMRAEAARARREEQDRPTGLMSVAMGSHRKRLSLEGADAALSKNGAAIPERRRRPSDAGATDSSPRDLRRSAREPDKAPGMAWSDSSPRNRRSRDSSQSTKPSNAGNTSPSNSPMNSSNSRKAKDDYQRKRLSGEWASSGLQLLEDKGSEVVSAMEWGRTASPGRPASSMSPRSPGSSPRSLDSGTGSVPLPALARMQQERAEEVMAADYPLPGVPQQRPRRSSRSEDNWSPREKSMSPTFSDRCPDRSAFHSPRPIKSASVTLPDQFHLPMSVD